MSRQHFASKDLELLENGLFADATITCGDRTWKVHKSIICRCEWFKAAFSGDFKDSQTNNASISAEDFSPELVDCVINFIYSGTVNNIEMIDTNDSLVDACVRLWAIADFLLMKELEKEAVDILKRYCADKAKQMCVMDHAVYETNAMFFAPDGVSYEALLAQLFCGIETAYSNYPHSVPCQQVLVDFFHRTRAFVFSSRKFHCCLYKASRQFSHELFMATIGGRESEWYIGDSEYNCLERKGNCTRCNDGIEKHISDWVVDPSMRHGRLRNGWGLNVRWHCIPCSRKTGFGAVSSEEEKLLRIQNAPNANTEQTRDAGKGQACI